MSSLKLSAREAREYNLTAALVVIADEIASDRPGARAGLAFEVHADLEREAREAGYVSKGGLFVPSSISVDPAAAHEAAVRAGLDSATATKGQELRFTEPGPFVEMLRVKAAVGRLGATFLTGLRGNVALPRQTAAATASWAAQNPGSDVADSNLLLDQVASAPKALTGTTSYSRQLLVQSKVSLDVDQLVRRDLALVHGVAIDAAAINGPGTNAPTGILNTSGVDKTTIAGGVNGAQPTWANVTGLERVVSSANADTDPAAMGYLTTPVLRNTMKNKDRTAGTSGWMIWSDGQQLNGYRAEVTNNVPATLTKGTAVGVCHALLFGLWQDLVVADWGALEIVPDPFRLKKQGVIELTSFQLADIVVRHPASFAAMVDALQ